MACTITWSFPLTKSIVNINIIFKNTSHVDEYKTGDFQIKFT